MLKVLPVSDFYFLSFKRSLSIAKSEADLAGNWGITSVAYFRNILMSLEKNTHEFFMYLSLQYSNI